VTMTVETEREARQYPYRFWWGVDFGIETQIPILGKRLTMIRR
jgi:hypothetical protein